MPFFVSALLASLKLSKMLLKTLVIMHGVIRDQRYLVGQELVNNPLAVTTQGEQVVAAD